MMVNLAVAGRLAARSAAVLGAAACALAVAGVPAQAHGDAQVKIFSKGPLVGGTHPCLRADSTFSGYSIALSEACGDLDETFYADYIAADGAYRYESYQYPGVCLGIDPSTNQGGAITVGAWTCNDASSEWRVQDTGDGYMVFHNKAAEDNGFWGQCLDRYSSPGDTRLYLSNCAGYDAQRWDPHWNGVS